MSERCIGDEREGRRPTSSSGRLGDGFTARLVSFKSNNPAVAHEKDGDVARRRDSVVRLQKGNNLRAVENVSLCRFDLES